MPSSTSTARHHEPASKSRCLAELETWSLLPKQTYPLLYTYCKPPDYRRGKHNRAFSGTETRKGTRQSRTKPRRPSWGTRKTARKPAYALGPGAPEGGTKPWPGAPRRGQRALLGHDLAKAAGQRWAPGEAKRAALRPNTKQRGGQLKLGGPEGKRDGARRSTHARGG